MMYNVRMLAISFNLIIILCFPLLLYSQERDLPEHMDTAFIENVLIGSGTGTLTMFDISYYKQQVSITTCLVSGQTSISRYFPQGQPLWFFSYKIVETGQKYESSFDEATFREFLQLCADNEICEMQSWHDPEFDQEDSFAYIILRKYDVIATIAYNTRTPESEPFWEVVDYIEDNFVAPALQNPVDKWWWEDYQWQ